MQSLQVKSRGNKFLFQWESESSKFKCQGRSSLSFFHEHPAVTPTLKSAALSVIPLLHCGDAFKARQPARFSHFQNNGTLSSWVDLGTSNRFNNQFLKKRKFVLFLTLTQEISLNMLRMMSDVFHSTVPTLWCPSDDYRADLVVYILCTFGFVFFIINT